MSENTLDIVLEYKEAISQRDKAIEQFKQSEKLFTDLMGELDDKERTKWEKLAGLAGSSKTKTTSKPAGTPNEKAKQVITRMVSSSSKNPKRVDIPSTKWDEIAGKSKCSREDVKATLKSDFDKLTKKDGTGGNSSVYVMKT